MARSRRRALALGLAVLALAPPAAAAQSRVLPSGGPIESRVSNPVLLDGSVLWTTSTRGAAAVWRADPGQPPHTVATAPAPDEPPALLDALQLRLSASADGVVVGRFVETCDGDCRYQSYVTRLDDVVAGPPDGALAVVPCTRNVAALAGPVLAATAACGPTPATILRRLGDDDPIARLPDERLVATAGPFVLTTEQDGRVHRVRNALTGAVVQTVRPEGDWRPVLGDDGTLVYVDGGTRSRRMVAARPGTVPTQIGATDAGFPIAVAGGRLLLRGAGNVLRVRALDSGGEAQDVPAPPIPGEVAFDGTRIAYVAQPCAARVVVVQEVDGPSPAELAQPCPAAVPTGAARVTRRGIALDLRCPAGPLAGCSARVSLVLQARRLGPGSRGQVFAGPTHAQLDGGAVRRVVVPASPVVRRYLRRFTPRRAVVTTSGDSIAPVTTTVPVIAG